jgi:Antibiotic biosynthesis monooxygenase
VRSYSTNRFISANVHASADGEPVVNYAQWENEQSFRAMLADPKASLTPNRACTAWHRCTIADQVGHDHTA